jgi:glycosyltransferase involved in cell wall biosynthesis
VEHLVNEAADISIITPTRDRPEVFALCERWMRGQDYTGRAQWIVVDDGERQARPTMGQEYIRRLRSVDKYTLGANLLAALERVRGKKIMIIEDDDYYPSCYVRIMADKLDQSSMVGEINARYYNFVERRWGMSGLTAHVSLCRTGLRLELASRLRDAAKAAQESGDFAVDLRFWGAYKGWSRPAVQVDMFQEPRLCVSIKGLPEAHKLGQSHRPGGMPNADTAYDVLRKWVGDSVVSAYTGLL